MTTRDPEKHRASLTRDPENHRGALTRDPDKPGEECGVFAVYAPAEDVGQLTYFGLYALQHRGQESAGIAVGDGEDVLVYSNLGLVNQVFDEKVLDGLAGHIAIGHVRYSTTGSSGMIENAQPAFS
jgi:amidophosphoribosyltransferase